MLHPTKKVAYKQENGTWFAVYEDFRNPVQDPEGIGATREEALQRLSEQELELEDESIEVVFFAYYHCPAGISYDKELRMKMPEDTIKPRFIEWLEYERRLLENQYKNTMVLVDCKIIK